MFAEPKHEWNFTFFCLYFFRCWQNLSIVNRQNNLLSISIYLQISTLIQHRSERPHVTSATSERTLRAIGRVGQAVNLAVERFVTVGETIADDNLDIKQDMYDACKEARAAGENKNVPFKQLYSQKCWNRLKNLGKPHNGTIRCVHCLIKILKRIFTSHNRKSFIV